MLWRAHGNGWMEVWRVYLEVRRTALSCARLVRMMTGIALNWPTRHWIMYSLLLLVVLLLWHHASRLRMQLWMSSLLLRLH